jgi:hypothetical protein
MHSWYQDQKMMWFGATPQDYRELWFILFLTIPEGLNVYRKSPLIENATPDGVVSMILQMVLYIFDLSKVRILVFRVFKQS